MKGAICAIRVAGLVLGVMAVLGLNHPAQAQQEDMRYNFALPFAVQWQGSTLPAGEYHFSVQAVPASTSGILIIRDAKGHTKTAASPVVMRTGGGFSAESTLTIVSRKGKMYVQSLRLGPNGTTREYEVPNLNKAEQRELAEPPKVVPVHSAANRG